VTEAAQEMKADVCPAGSLIAMGHCHLTGGDESLDSERRLVIGGAEALSVETFSTDIAYVALGHLHKAQRFHDGRIRYSGSPIPLSFAESQYDHQIVQLTFEDHRLTHVTTIPIPRSVAMITVPKQGFATITEVLSLLEQWTASHPSLPAGTVGDHAALINHPETANNSRDLGHVELIQITATLPADQHPFLEVRVLEDHPDPTRRKKIEHALEGKPIRLASIKVEYPGRKRDDPNAANGMESIDLKAINPEDIFLSAHQEKYDTPADESLVNAFREILLQEVHTS
jgi:exonuclease SbcD